MGAVIWFTGLSGSGKTTLANALSTELQKLGVKTQCLDGDAIRSVVGNSGFSAEARSLHLRYVALTASLLEAQGVFVLCSFVSPLRSQRAFARELSGHFCEIYLNTPLEVCEARDTKGLYKRARQGSLEEFTGVSSPYEAPENPDLTLDASLLDLRTEVNEVLQLLKERSILHDS